MFPKYKMHKKISKQKNMLKKRLQNFSKDLKIYNYVNFKYLRFNNTINSKLESQYYNERQILMNTYPSYA